jgi:predicted metal-dependent phosphoesterase TrpH
MNNVNPCDLHIHSCYSDGKLHPSQIIETAAGLGLSAVSITDHDTVAGQMEAINAGKQWNVEVIPGIEFSTRESGMDIHIIGYMIDPGEENLVGILGNLARAREKRAMQMVEKLRAEKLPISFDDVRKAAGGGVIGRPHIASILMKRGVVDHFQEAFNRYIGTGKKCWVPKRVLSFEEVLSVIRTAGGVSVWAHPGDSIRNESMVDRMIAGGVEGLEVWHPNHNDFVTALIEEVAERNNLIRTGGSDFHFNEAMKVGIGEIKIPYSSVVELKRSAERHLS